MRLNDGAIQQLPALCEHLLPRGCSQGRRLSARTVDTFVGGGLRLNRVCLVSILAPIYCLLLFLNRARISNLERPSEPNESGA
jgi:hypothetical protein